MQTIIALPSIASTRFSKCATAEMGSQNDEVRIRAALTSSFILLPFPTVPAKPMNDALGRESDGVEILTLVLHPIRAHGSGTIVISNATRILRMVNRWLRVMD